VLVHLIFDPYRIYGGEGQRVARLEEELAAFRDIGDVLRQDTDSTTRRPRTYVLDRTAWEHFRSLRSVKGGRTREYTPRGEMQSLLGAGPPTWLTDEGIVEYDLLRRPGPSGVVPDGWAATVATWLLPGVVEAPNLGEWLRAAASAPACPEPIRMAPVMDWLVEQFQSLAAQVITLPDVVAGLAGELRESGAPVAFACDWVRRKALLPLTRPAADRSLAVPGLSPESALNLARANYLSALFPLPQPLHADVSRLFSQAVRIAQIEKPLDFEGAVVSLNALWDGVAEELERWLEINPRGMTEKAARHLASLPGYEGSELAQRLVRQYAPPAPVARWTGLDAGFDDWVNAYASYIERLFYQRTLPAREDDPAQPFARWLKANPTVFFNHPERGYFCLAHLVQQSLRQGRAVLVVLMDALAAHVAAPALEAFQEQLGEAPTRLRYCFSPVPTITEVCKEAILGGALPEACHGDLARTLERRYGLTDEQHQLAAHWQDAERVRVTRPVRLLVYRDNRLDELLGSVTSYNMLRQGFGPIISSAARLVRRWVDEFRHWHGSYPTVILTADHGFTYGPKAGQETSGRRLDGSHRCVELGSSKPEDSELRDESLTFLDRETFHLRGSYLVARGRTFGQGTLSGWALSHGGLLPEEVIIPVAEWFGDRQALPFPDITAPAGATRDRGQWVVTLELRNNHPVPTAGGRLRVTLAGEGTGPAAAYPPLKPGASHQLPLEVPGPEPAGAQEVVLEVMLSPRGAGVPTAPDLVRHVPVSRAKQFIERTQDQDAFEGMF
jgi:hypothetical protein